ncbi:ABC transporter substrate-binding protein [Roseimaritima ulvae]|uniref:Spermidine/putrescine ABC transporter periplasmic substrate-binding protein n=1 Tax=Roseimaritima ulvae TaxID=980254 RepID=A0A5B9QRG9_9BACT|nr:extracellular solute-binding protein [Roseimaritima ulvae]QEG40542.1 hypothetical protein UC8_25570 [Roseimaritima ulvae]
MTINRRQFLATSATTAAGAALPAGLKGDDPPAAPAAPAVHVKRRTTLRVLGTHVTLQEQIRRRAEADLGIRLIFEPGGSAAVLHRASTNPQSFDLYEQWTDSIRVLWQAGTIQPIDTERIRYWDEINPLTKTGQLTPTANVGAGDAPHTILYAQHDDSLSCHPTPQLSYLPYVHNVDSFGYNAAVVPRGEAYKTESWAWLLDRQWAGKVAVINAPTIGLFDLAMAVAAKGLMEFENIGNLTRSELDELFAILIDYRRRGHFRGVWSSVPQSVDWMGRGETVIESMFSPAVFDLRSRDVNCVYASPREGYRGWHGVICMSSQVDGAVKDAAYDYMNWWLSGWPGAYIARQGYYICNPERSRGEMSADEWDYWYLGKPARRALPGTSGHTVVDAGAIRDGGSYEQRFSNIAVWNSVMDSYEYSLARWNEFVSS